MKRKYITLLTLLALILSLSISALATEMEGPWVIDNAVLLNDNEVADLNRQIEQLRSRLEMEIVIVTTYGTGSKNVQQYADDFYDENGYGYGPTDSGILLLLDMETREWYMSTCGEAIYIFTDYGLDQLGQAIVSDLSYGYYYRAFTTWIQSLPQYVEGYRSGTPVDGYVSPDEYESPYGDEIIYQEMPIGIRIQPFPVGLVVGLIAAAIAVLIMRSSMNTAKLQKHAADYLKDGSFRLRQRSDMYLYSRVSKSPRPKNNTSHHGGGSSVHRSSGGVRHGGRGGRF